MENIHTLNMVIRVAIIPSGVILRVIIILIKMIHEEETHIYHKKIKNTIIFGIVAQSIYIIYDILRHYYIS